MTAKLRILLVDDHNLFRSGVKALLTRQPDFDVIGEAADGLEGVKAARDLKSDLVLLDLHMPGISGKEALRMIRDENPSLPVIMLTVSEDAADLIETLQAGARGYLLKNVDADYFSDAIRRAARGEAVVAERMTGKLVAGLQNAPREPVAAADHDRLTTREREVLALLAGGSSNKEMARDLGLAESTVKIHVQAILRKLNLSSRVQAAVYAVEAGIAPRNRNGGS